MGCKAPFHVDIMDLHDGVTGSAHLCSVAFPDSDERLKFLVDFGTFQKEHEERMEDDAENDEDLEDEKRLEEEKELAKKNAYIPFKSSEISFVLVTHNHVDHVGRLPMLVKNGFYGKIYTTISTTKLLPYGSKDNCSVQRKKAKHAGIQEVMYSEADVIQTLNLCVPCEYREPIKVDDRVDVYFFRNSHLPGAALILVKIKCPGYEDINILFTGDYNKSSMFLYETSIPKWVLNLPITIVQESTYGDTESSEDKPCFEANLLKAIERKKTVLCMVFSLGRTQEILYILKRLQNEGKLDENIPVYLDGGLAIKYTNLYAKGELDIKPDMCDFLPKNFTKVEDKNVRNFLLGDDSCKIILTSSGMGSYGPARTYIPALLERKNVLMHFTGYTAEGTLGRRLKDTPCGETIKVSGNVVWKRADVEYTSEFSAHARADTMIDFLKQFTKLQLVLVNHGEPEVKEKFARRIMEEVKPKNTGILNRQTLFRVSTWGIVKTIPTKFI